MIEIKSRKFLWMDERFKIINYNVDDLFDKIDVDLIELKEKYKKLVLQIDGGGIMGIIPLLNLYILEEKYGELRNYFKTYWGTSAGSIITSLISTGVLNMKDLLKIYVEESYKIFDKKSGGLYNIFTTKGYKTKYIEALLNKHLKYLTFDSLYKNDGIELNIPVVRILEKDTLICNHINTPNWPIRVAVRASISAPAYFGPYYWKESKTRKRYAFFDGGTGAYSCTLEKAINKEYYSDRVDIKDFFVYSLGTGILNYKIPRDDKEREREIDKIKRLRKLKQFAWTFDFGREESTSRQVRYAKYLKNNIGLNYNRFDIFLPKNLLKMDEVDNVNELIDFTQRFINELTKKN